MKSPPSHRCLPLLTFQSVICHLPQVFVSHLWQWPVLRWELRWCDLDFLCGPTPPIGVPPSEGFECSSSLSLFSGCSRGIRTFFWVFSLWEWVSVGGWALWVSALILPPRFPSLCDPRPSCSFVGIKSLAPSLNSIHHRNLFISQLCTICLVTF